jgi:hypothetical protein
MALPLGIVVGGKIFVCVGNDIRILLVVSEVIVGYVLFLFSLCPPSTRWQNWWGGGGQGALANLI